MTLFVSIVLAVLTFAVIIYPLFRQRLRSVNSGEDEKLRELYSKRDTAYSMLKELEFDFQSGTLTKEDYQELEARYKRKAIPIIRNIDDMEKGTGVEEEIEKRVLKLRRGKGRFCPQCGARYQGDDRFCSHCGTSLNQGGHID